MLNFLVLSNDYHKTDIGLYRNAAQIALISDPAKRSSKSLIPFIKDLLVKNNILLEDLSFIAVNQGPGKFTSLRVLLATTNGLSFAANIPLVGIDGITTLLDEAHSDGITVALLNAFNNDAFFGIANENTEYETGYKNIEILLNELKDEYLQKIFFIGNGTALFHEELKSILGDQAVIQADYPQSASIDFIAQTALKKFQKGQTTHQLMPLYLKKPHYKKAIES